jgi:hypothetical protein
MTQPSLRPQDVVVLAKLIVHGGPRPTFARLGADLSMSSSEVHAAFRRLAEARLVSGNSRVAQPNLQATEEFLVHGVRYAFPARRGALTRGVPTGYAAPPLNKVIVADEEPPPVWPHADGSTRGVGLEPLYRTVPSAALRDPAVYEILALIDALRDGRARERKLAERHLHARIHGDPAARSKSISARAHR